MPNLVDLYTSSFSDPYKVAESFVSQWKNKGGGLSREDIYGRLSNQFGVDQAARLVYGSGLFPDMPQAGATAPKPPTYGGGGYGIPAPVAIPEFNIANVYSQARQKAAGVVNPYYQEQLNQFLGRQNVLKQRAQQNYETQIQDYEKGLKDYLEQSGITRGRTEEDVATNLGQLREDEITRQLGEGRGFDIGLRGLRDYLGTAGLTRSGLGRQQIAGAKEERKFAEEGAVKEVGRKTQAQELYKTRTLGDLARGEKLKGEATETGKKRSKIDLDREFEDFLFQETTTKQQLEQERMQRELRETENQYQLSLRDYFSKLNPRQLERARGIYG